MTRPDASERERECPVHGLSRHLCICPVQPTTERERVPSAEELLWESHGPRTSWQDGAKMLAERLHAALVENKRLRRLVDIAHNELEGKVYK